MTDNQTPEILEELKQISYLKLQMHRYSGDAQTVKELYDSILDGIWNARDALAKEEIKATRQEMQAEIDKRDTRIKELISLYLDGSPIEDKFQQMNYERVLEIEEELNQRGEDEANTK